MDHLSLELHQLASRPQRKQDDSAPDDVWAGRQAFDETSIRTEPAVWVQRYPEEGHCHHRPEAAAHRKPRPPAPVWRAPEAPGDDQEAHRHRTHNDDKPSGMQRVLDKDADAEQAHAFETMHDGIPARAHPAGENLAPDNGEPEDAEAAEDKVGALDPPAWTKTERTNGLLPGSVARSGRPLDRIDGQEEDSSGDPDGQPHEQVARNGSRTKRCWEGRRSPLRRRG